MTWTLGSAGRGLPRLAAGLGLAALILIPAACDGIVVSDDPRGPDTVAGEWVGHVGSESVEMTLQQPDSISVSGFGVLRRPGTARAFRVEGVRDGGRITLLLEISVTTLGDTGIALAHFGGRFVGAHRIEGRLSGAGYSDAPMTLQRDRQIR
jgi:hypothetical protein